MFWLFDYFLAHYQVIDNEHESSAHHYPDHVLRSLLGGTLIIILRHDLDKDEQESDLDKDEQESDRNII